MFQIDSFPFLYCRIVLTVHWIMVRSTGVEPDENTLDRLWLCGDLRSGNYWAGDSIAVKRMDLYQIGMREARIIQERK
jgi:hypothetical protein